MLSVILFCITSFLSIFWLGISCIYIDSHIGWGNLLSMNPSNLAFFITAIFVPVIVLWVGIGFAQYAFAIRRQGRFLEIMLYHLKKSSDQSTVITKNLLESREILRGSEALKYIDTAVADLNNTIADIAIRFGIMRKISIGELWHKVSEGDKWAFCNVILDNCEDIKSFEATLPARMEASKDLNLSIHNFCERFEQLYEMLNQNENNRPLANLIDHSKLGDLYRKLNRLKVNAPDPMTTDEDIPESYIRSLFTDEPIDDTRHLSASNIETVQIESSKTMLSNETNADAISQVEYANDLSLHNDPDVMAEFEEIAVTKTPRPKVSIFTRIKKAKSKVSMETSRPSEDEKMANYDWNERKKEILDRYGPLKKD